MDHSIHSKHDFPETINTIISSVNGKLEFGEDPQRYRISTGAHVISMIDKGTEGILITATAGNEQIRSDAVYNWSDAYQICLLLTRESMSCGSQPLCYYDRSDYLRKTGKEDQIRKEREIYAAQNRSLPKNFEKNFNECREHARQIVLENRDQMAKLIDVLLEKNCLDGDYVQSCFRRNVNG